MWDKSPLLPYIHSPTFMCTSGTLLVPSGFHPVDGNLHDTGSNISSLRQPSFHKYPTMSFKVRRLSNTIALWGTPTPTSASESWRRRFCPASAIWSVYMLLEDFQSQSGLSGPWLWDSPAFVPSRSWSSNRRISLDSSPMSRMLMPSKSVLVSETLFGVYYEPWWGAVSRLTRFRSVWFWTRVDSVSDTCCWTCSEWLR